VIGKAGAGSWTFAANVLADYRAVKSVSDDTSGESFGIVQLLSPLWRREVYVVHKISN